MRTGYTELTEQALELISAKGRSQIVCCGMDTCLLKWVRLDCLSA
ncbi:hypothetical protein [Catellatospora sp. NPDC049609]